MTTVETTSNTLHVLIGLPRSGKSTYAKTTGHPVVNPDSIRLALHGQAFVPQAEPFVWAIAHKMVEALFLAGHTDVVLDATNTTPKRRREWDGQWACKYIYFDTPQELCIERAKADGKAYLVLVIERMAKSLDVSDLVKITVMQSAEP